VPVSSDPRHRYQSTTRLGALLRLKRHETEPYLTLEAAARKWGVQETSLWRWETGQKPGLEQFLQVCAMTGIAPIPEVLDPPEPDEDLKQWLTSTVRLARKPLLEIKAHLESIVVSDKTLPYRVGEINAAGRKPDRGASWARPKELAQRCLHIISQAIGDEGGPEGDGN